MKKLLFILAGITSFSTTLFSQTNVNGVIGSSVTWTTQNSPYIVTGNTVISSNVTITIEPGVTVRFRKNKQLLLRGNLVGLGTVTDTIQFISDTAANQWAGILVDNASYNPNVNLRYLKAVNSNILFNVSSYSAGNSDTLISLVNCVFDKHDRVIDYTSDSPKNHFIYVDSCSITTFSYYFSWTASNMIIKNTKFNGQNCPYGRALYNGTGQATIIDHCEFSGFSDCAVLVGGSITNSTFFGNNYAVSTMGDNDPSLHYNDISNNQNGIAAWNYNVPNSASQITNNKICNTQYNIVKIYSADTYAPNNCWCLNDSALIQAKMMDFFTQANLGIVYFMPFDVSCISATEVVEQQINKKDQFTLFPNPAKGFVNFKLNDLSEGQKTELEILDIQGNIIFKALLTTENNQTAIDLREMSNGVYLLKIKTNSGIQIRKFIKE